MEGWNQLAFKALDMALTLSSDVVAVHLSQLSGPDQDEHRQSLQAQWRACVEGPVRASGLPSPHLVVLPARYRAIHEPVLRLAHELESHSEGRRIAVLIPPIVKQHWYQHLLHRDRGRKLRSRLLRCGDPRLVVIDAPWMGAA